MVRYERKDVLCWFTSFGSMLRRRGGHELKPVVELWSCGVEIYGFCHYKTLIQPRSEQVFL